jgi:hypothetical protein
VTTAGNDPGQAPRLVPSADGFWTVVIVKYFFDHGKLGCCLVFGTRAEGSEGWMMLMMLFLFDCHFWKKQECGF